MEVSGVRLGLLRPSYAGLLRRRCSTPLMVTPHDRLEHRRGRIGLVLTGDSSDLELRLLGMDSGGGRLVEVYLVGDASCWLKRSGGRTRHPRAPLTRASSLRQILLHEPTNARSKMSSYL